MNVATLLHLAFPLSIALIVFALGLRCRPSEVIYLLRERSLLLRSIAAMNVLQPIVAALLVSLTHVHAAVKIALVALAVSPVPPILPGKELKLVTRDSYVYGLLVATSVLAIILVPVTIALLGALSGRELRVAPVTVARIVGGSILVPLGFGVLIGHLLPTFAAKANPIVSRIGTLVLMLAAVVALCALWRPISWLIGDGTLLLCIVFATIGLVVGHTLAGPASDDRTVLALSTAARHPGVAVAIGAAAFPGQKMVPAAVVLYLLASAIVSVPYTAWRRRLHAGVAPGTPA